ncbi:MAG: 5'/3'-nucleotidase SurE, partial [Gammaproteobacteria bacterium]
LGLPTVALSLRRPGAGEPDFTAAGRVARLVVERLLAAPLERSMILNINVPHLPFERLRGFRSTRLGARHRADRVVPTTDPRGRPVWWVGAAVEGEDDGPGTDFNAVAEGYVSVTPLQVDLTRHAALDQVARWLDGIG